MCFVFLYVFPKIGSSVGGTGSAESEFATVLVAGVVGLSIMFQGIQAVALPMVQEFGYTKEIEDRVLAPLPVWVVAVEKVTAGAIQGLIAAFIVFPIAAVVHVSEIHIHLAVHWPVLLTLMPLACVTCAALGLTFGTIFDPRQVPILFGIIILPMTFLGGTYYAWTGAGTGQDRRLVVVADTRAGQPADLRQPRASGPRLPRRRTCLSSLIYPVLSGFCALFLWLGIRGFKRRVLS